MLLLVPILRLSFDIWNHCHIKKCVWQNLILTHITYLAKLATLGFCIRVCLDFVPKGKHTVKIPQYRAAVKLLNYKEQWFVGYILSALWPLSCPDPTEAARRSFTQTRPTIQHDLLPLRGSFINIDIMPASSLHLKQPEVVTNWTTDEKPGWNTFEFC